jgi:uncharacterized protein
MFGIYLKTYNKLQKIFSEHPNVSAVKIYGSRAKGNYREGSDIDLMIIGRITKTELTEIINEIDDQNTPYLYDISRLEDTKSPNLIDHIHRIGKIFYEKV